MTSDAMPSWIANVPLKTVGVLCATHIFGKNIESRQIVMAGKRYFHFSIVKHDMDKLDQNDINLVILARARDEVLSGLGVFEQRRDTYDSLLKRLYASIEFVPETAASV